jgi:hypothetical protein
LLLTALAAPVSGNSGQIPLSTGFDYPVGPTTVTQIKDGDGYYNYRDFGNVRHLGEDWNGENGGDSDLGDPVYSISEGRIVYADNAGPEWGNVVVIEHLLPSGTRIQSLYGHLASMLKTAGSVARREQIGTIGKGYYYGQKAGVDIYDYDAHLHFEIRTDVALLIPGPGYGPNQVGRTDPSDFIDSHRTLGPPPPPSPPPPPNPPPPVVDTEEVQTPSGVSSGRLQHALAYDEVRRESVMFAGATDLGVGLTLSDETWVWDGAVWTLQNSQQSPQARSRHSIVFDSAREKAVLFGGTGNGFILGDTWTWNGSGWSLENPPDSPSPRTGHAMVYDTVRQETVLFGGAESFGQLSDETWVWNGNAWTVRQPAVSPPARSIASMFFDEGSSRVVLFGGVNASGQVVNDTWVWDGISWSQVNAGTSPSARYGAAAAYDAAAQLGVLFGGADATNQTLNDIWLWNGTTWQQVQSPMAPPPRVYSAMAFDSSQSVIWLYGGTTSAFNLVPLNDMWRFTLTGSR